MTDTAPVEILTKRLGLLLFKEVSPEQTTASRIPFIGNLHA